MNDLEILYEDGEALVIDKPAGLPIDRPRKGGASLGDRLDELKLGFQRQPQPAHRLDTDTSGCLLLARNPKSLKRFNMAFEEKVVSKTYLGILAGIPEQKEGRIELSLAKISSAEKGWRMIPAKKGKESATGWRVLAEVNGRALVEFRPETGRTHQIRVHAASGIGIPLLGDPVYGEKSGFARTMLHASAIEVPRAGKSAIAAHSPMPADFIALGFADVGAVPVAGAVTADVPQAPEIPETDVQT
ncbi:RNA pseudouridine synthase [Alteraurantiacibacter aestuarii]|uniref:RNA pseudouridine synthase n=1 Tax=Alteraurantiacibacter aestuarii TaxID=650004 RepID=A0A844ZRZ8_9SPHN|nr:RNA pseudouridine synthase [Alteraurantiacibacter aestuarii]MXO88379.1 RNA pseudouridine synthase [Alteraurantiacibacter aestuarii]